jgi:hypothetical protein
MFYLISFSQLRARESLRKNGSVDGAFFGAGVSPEVEGSEKLKNRFRKSRAS